MVKSKRGPSEKQIQYRKLFSQAVKSAKGLKGTAYKAAIKQFMNANKK